MVPDRRIKRTKTAIKNALIELLNEKALSKITVTNIVELADISRSTFYLHYNDVYDLFDQLTNDVLADLVNIFNNSYPKTNYDSFLTVSQKLLDYVDRNHSFVKLLLQNNVINFTDRIKPLFIKLVLKSEKIDPHDVVNDAWIRFSVSGIIGLLVDWLNDDIKADKAKMSIIIKEIIDSI